MRRISALVAGICAASWVGCNGGNGDNDAIGGAGAEFDASLYYTKTDIDTRFYTKSDLEGGALDARYSTKTEASAAFAPASTVDDLAAEHSAQQYHAVGAMNQAATAPSVPAGVEYDIAYTTETVDPLHLIPPEGPVGIMAPDTGYYLVQVSGIFKYGSDAGARGSLRVYSASSAAPTPVEVFVVERALKTEGGEAGDTLVAGTKLLHLAAGDGLIIKASHTNSTAKQVLGAQLLILRIPGWEQ
jgi:hypothetical protein